MDIKQIQNDTLSHLVLDDAIRYGFFVDAQSIVQRIINWHANSAREEMAATQVAYEKGNYTQVFEFELFRERCELSSQRMAAEIQKQFLSFVLLEKDAATLHSFLTKRREAIADNVKRTNRSIESQIASLIANQDYGVIQCFDAKGNPIHSKLNFPSPAVYPKSYFLPLNTLIQRQDPDTWMVNDITRQYYRLQLLIPDMLFNALEVNAVDLRRDLATFKSLLETCQLLSFAENATPSSESFSDMNWQLIFLMLECAACVIECKQVTNKYLDNVGTHTPEDETFALQDHTLRWNAIQRQFNVISTLLSNVIQVLMSSLVVGDSMDIAQQVIHGASNSPAPKFRPEGLQSLVLFTSYTNNILLALEESWSTQIPNKKTLKKVRKAKSDKLSSDGQKAEAAALDILVEIRVSLAALFKSHKTEFDKLSELINRVKTASESSESVHGGVAALRAHQSLIPFFNGIEQNAHVRSIMDGIQQSHRSSLSNALTVLRMCDPIFALLKM